MSDYYGFFARGEAGNLIIGPDHPVLARYFGGDIKVTHLPATPYSDQGIASCLISYGRAFTTLHPPMVFGVPNLYYKGGAVGRFSHIGRPGAWTGFRVIFITSIRYTHDTFNYIYAAQIGQHTGWSYRVCGFEAPQSGDEYGMRVWDGKGKLVFDSGWPITPFRGLLKNWQQAEGGYYTPGAYWGSSFWNSTSIDDADRYGLYRHAWGARDGDMGILLSQLCTMVVMADTGDKNTQIKTIPMIGFEGVDRANISCSLAYGTIQHAGTAGPALNNFGLLTADFSRT
ncbi:hypothetical protein WG219_10070 [Ectopseudomonas mendocina]|uniref:Lysin A n=1 Tax=Ectopseudomonas mendocina TaxID=300 RepID=A0ABZ2RL96_ECTME